MLPPFQKAIAPVNDTHDDLLTQQATPEYLDEQARLLAGLGFSRVYLIPPLNAAMAPWRYGIRRDLEARTAELLDRFGDQDPFRATVEAAHRHELEVFAVYKPYEGGAHRSVPENDPAASPHTSLPQLGGPGIVADPFLVQHPELRVRRRADAALDRLAADPLTTIELVFCMDEVLQPGIMSSQPPVVFSGQPDTALQTNPVESVSIWTSSNNGTYDRLSGSSRVSERVERRTLFDTIGREIPGGPRRCRVVRVSGLNCDGGVRYLAISLVARDPAQFVTIPFTMIRAYNADGENMPVTVSDAPRAANNPVSPESNRLCDRGFEFDPMGFYYREPGWRATSLFAIARGRNDFMHGTPCEAYPEVREQWLRDADYLIESGVDGVDVRAQNHSSSVVEYHEYGYNEPLVTAYRDRYGRDIQAEPAEPLRMMQIRGDFYLQFMAKLRSKLSARGKKLQVHLHGNYEDPRLCGDFNEVAFWAMPKILPDWKRLVDLADEITIKDYYFGSYSPQNAANIKARAADAGKPVWIHCYQQQGDDLNRDFCAAAQADPTVSGLLLYEITGHGSEHGSAGDGLVRIDGDGTAELIPGAVDALRRLTRYGK